MVEMSLDEGLVMLQKDIQKNADCIRHLTDAFMILADEVKLMKDGK